MFTRFVEDFTQTNLVPSKFAETAHKRGVELHWIGVGTWQPPNEVISDRHLEAWQISTENIIRGSASVMTELRDEAYLQQILTLVQEVPFESIRKARTRFQRADDIIRQAVLDYREQLIEALRRI